MSYLNRPTTLATAMRTLGLALLFATAPAAQITLTEATYREPFFDDGVSSIFSTDATGISPDDAATIRALLDQTGAGQTWDFTSLDVLPGPDSQVERIEDLVGLPGASLFPDATVVFTAGFVGATGPDSVSYNYARIADGAYSRLGTVVETASGLLVTTFTEGLTTATFPFTVGTRVSDSAVATTQPVSAPSTRGYDAEVVGSGTVVLPRGSFDALQVRITETTTAGGSTSSFESTYWLTADGVTVEAGDVPGGLRFAQWSVPAASTAVPSAPEPLALTVGPTPTQGRAVIRATLPTAGDVRADVFDLLGRSVAALWNGPRPAGRLELRTPAGLPAGVYLVRVEMAGAVGVSRLVIAR